MKRYPRYRSISYDQRCLDLLLCAACSPAPEAAAAASAAGLGRLLLLRLRTIAAVVAGGAAASTGMTDSFAAVCGGWPGAGLAVASTVASADATPAEGESRGATSSADKGADNDDEVVAGCARPV